MRLDRGLCGPDRPMPPGRSGPRNRGGEVTRPSPVYRYAVYASIAKLCVIERLREEGFSPISGA